jgi:hypothetical protein
MLVVAMMLGGKFMLLSSGKKLPIQMFIKQKEKVNKWLWRGVLAQYQSPRGANEV